MTCRSIQATALLLALLLALPACGGGSSPASASSTTNGQGLKIYVTDAPFPSNYVASATVVIKEVQVHEKTSGAWHTVFSGSRTIDLVPLTGGVSELLVDATLDPGTYNEARLIVEAGTVTLTPDAVVMNDEVFSIQDGDLRFPSASQTGIKVKIDNDVVVTTELSGALLLDFDLSNSFVFNGSFTRAPGVRRVIFTPVVRATNSSTNGTLALDVNSDKATPADTDDDFALAGATVRVFDGADAEVAMGLTDANGHFESVLPPDTYKVTIEADGHESTEVAGAAVALANLTDLGAVALVASETEIAGVVLSDGATAADTTDDTNVVGALVEAIVSGDATNTVVASATTDANGAFVLSTLAPGDYDLTVSASGWTTQIVSSVAAVFPGSASGVTATLAALTRDLTGTVTDSAAVALNGVTVTITNANGTVILASTATGSDGIYSITGVPSGSHTLTADDGVATVALPITVVGTGPATSQTVDVQYP